MPHLTLEYSANIAEKNALLPLFPILHQTLADILPTELASCKSRAKEYSAYYIGDGNVHNAFVHLQIRVMPGRSEETLQKLGQAVLDILKDFFQHSAATLSLQITLELGELKKTYYKYVSSKK